MSAYITKAKVIAVGVPLLLGQVVGALQGGDTLTWFKTLKKPAWCPPIPAFPVVWTALYALMGYASYIVWTYGGWEAQKGPLLFYGIQLVLNLAWPIIFFKSKALKIAQAENLVLLVAAALTTNSFWRVDRVAGRLMFPYLAWLLLANFLNISVASKNQGAEQSAKREDLYHPDDKRNPGEQGFFSQNPTSACLQVPAAGVRGRGRLTIIAQSARTRARPMGLLRRQPTRRGAAVYSATASKLSFA